MLIYLAGLEAIYKSYKDWLSLFPSEDLNQLTSYWELRFFDGHSLPKIGNNYFLDSGAFSAQREHVVIAVQDYANFLKKYGHQTTLYANLDVIPTTCSVDEAAERSLSNQQFLEAEGLHPTPVFHKGEDERFLDYYLDRGYEYLCVGGLVETGNEGSLDSFFDHIWSTKLTDSNGVPKLKVHGFGMTNISLMLRYPWYSVDSSTWLIQSKLGWLTIPKRGPEGWLWNEKPQQVAVSNESAARNQLGKHYDTMTPAQREIIDLWISDFHPDVSIDQLRDHPVARLATNVHYWVSLQKNAKWATTYQKREVDLI